MQTSFSNVGAEGVEPPLSTLRLPHKGQFGGRLYRQQSALGANLATLKQATLVICTTKVWVENYRYSHTLSFLSIFF